MPRLTDSGAAPLLHHGTGGVWPLQGFCGRGVPVGWRRHVLPTSGMRLGLPAGCTGHASHLSSLQGPRFFFFFFCLVLSFWAVLFICLGPHRLTFTWWGCYSLCPGHKPAELAHSFLFCSCVCFCLYGPFDCISFHKFSQQLSTFSLCSSGLILLGWLLWKIVPWL